MKKLAIADEQRMAATVAAFNQGLPGAIARGLVPPDAQPIAEPPLDELTACGNCGRQLRVGETHMPLTKNVPYGNCIVFTTRMDEEAEGESK